MKLEDVNKETEPFKIPDGYFDQLYGAILDNKAVKPRLYFKPVKVLAYACLFLALGFGGIWWYYQPVEAPCSSLACIDDESLLQEANRYDINAVIEYTNHQDKSDSSALFLNEIDEADLLNEL